MLRWFKKENAKNGTSSPEAAGAPADDWAYLRAQPDFDADEMADVHAPTVANGYSHSPDGSDRFDSSVSADWETSYTAAGPAHETPALGAHSATPTASPSWSAPERRSSFSADEGPELQLTLSCGNSVVDECLKGSVLIGKLDLDREVFPEIDLSLDRDVSPRHAMILLRASGYVLKDVGSERGTFLNGRRLPLGEEAPLGPGDEIKVGAITSLIVPRPVSAQEEDDIHLSDEDRELAELALQASGAMPLPQPRFAVPPTHPTPEPQIPTASMDLLDLALVRGESLSGSAEEESLDTAFSRRDFGGAQFRSHQSHEFDQPVGMTARWSSPSDESACDR